MKHLIILFLALVVSIDATAQTRGVSYDNATKNVIQTDLDYVMATLNVTGTMQHNGVGVVNTGRILTLTGTANEIDVSPGGQSLAADRTWTFSLPNALTFTGKTITGGTFATPTISGSIVFPDGTRQTFNPNGTTPGLNVGSHTSDPSTPSNGDVWYNSTDNQFKARINGASVALGSGSGTGDVVGPASSTDNAIVRYDGATGKLIQNSAATIDDSGNINTSGTGSFGSGNGTLHLGAAGTRFSLAGDGDGALTFSGDGDGNDEDFTINLDDTANTAVISSSTGMNSWDFGTGWNFKLGTIDIGAASDTTISRSAAGIIAVEGSDLINTNSTQTAWNKTIHTGTISGTLTYTTTALSATDATNFVADFQYPSATITASANINFLQSTNRASSRSMTILIDPNGSARTLTFNSSWKWLTAKPSTIASGASGRLSIFVNGTAETDVQAAYAVTGGYGAFSISSKTTTYTATADDYTILCDTTSAGFTVTLPAAASVPGKIYNIKKISSDGNTLTIDGNASETIDDTATKTTTTQYVNFMIQSDGSEWWVLQ